MLFFLWSADDCISKSAFEEKDPEIIIKKMCSNGADDPDRYYKLNLTNILSNGKKTIEFRQHSATRNREKACMWIFLLSCFIQRAIESDIRKFEQVDPPQLLRELLEFAFKDTENSDYFTKYWQTRAAALKDKRSRRKNNLITK